MLRAPSSLSTQETQKLQLLCAPEIQIPTSSAQGGTFSGGFVRTLPVPTEVTVPDT